MNETVKTFLLAGDKFMPGKHLSHPGFTFRTCGPLTHKKERIQKFNEPEDMPYIYQKELHKAK